MPKVKWFTPVRMLLMFCAMSFIIYIDRGALSSTSVNGSARSVKDPKGTGIQGHFNLTLVQDGLLSSAFMVGLVIASPIFAEVAKSRNAFRLVGLGLLVWVVAVAGCGASFHYYMLLICRMFVGVGEASFVTLAAPFIDDHAPHNQKSLWFGLFLMTAPAGYAAGYIFGGVVGLNLGWRAVFYIEAVVMLPLVVFCFCAQPIDLKKDDTTEVQMKTSLRGAVGQFFVDVGSIFGHPLYVFTLISNTLQNGVIGGFAYWGPRAALVAFDLKGDSSNIIFGLLTVLTGIAGTLMGGVILDLLGANFRNATLVSGVGLLSGSVFMVIPFVLLYSIYGFVPVFGFGQACNFVAIAPMTAISLWSIPTVLRPLGCSIMTASTHIFGDVPSPPIIGAVQTFLDRYMSEAMAWRYAMGLTAATMLASAGCMFVGACYAKYAKDYREESQKEEPEVENFQILDEPLLLDSGKTSETM
eukprot:TRINITY_DN578_c0_g2_i1.p1 TRINITY_DN578_c0_g2~~TRINITY_DN578_c0_g2_i1.p1  ORF type:complete len:469 (-),score=68.25 TRINITY_DN578_c0_g2_i1:266-1672(-)